VRVLLDQHRADKRRGLNTATFVSGYQGSPLGGFDKELLRLRKVADDHGIHFTPASTRSSPRRRSTARSWR
jgi:indolepyruvate ferredoxin oxidoreductase